MAKKSADRADRASSPTAAAAEVKSLRAPCEAALLRIFLGDDDVYGDKPLYDQLVLKARELGLAGATVTRGLLAFGPATIRSESRLRLSEDLPVIVEIIDTEESVRRFLEAADGMLESGVATLQSVSVLRYGRKNPQ